MKTAKEWCKLTSDLQDVDWGTPELFIKDVQEDAQKELLEQIVEYKERCYEYEKTISELEEELQCEYELQAGEDI